MLRVVPPIGTGETTHGLCPSCDERIRRESGLRPRPVETAVPEFLRPAS
jgi:hypothetical protein